MRSRWNRVETNEGHHEIHDPNEESMSDKQRIIFHLDNRLQPFCNAFNEYHYFTEKRRLMLFSDYDNYKNNHQNQCNNYPDYNQWRMKEKGSFGTHRHDKTINYETLKH